MRLVVVLEWFKKCSMSSIVICAIIILLVREHGISLHLCMLSLISLISVLQFSVCSSFVSLGRFIPRHFILFLSLVNGIVSFSDFSSLVYRNACVFYALILYPATLLNSSMMS